MCFPKELGGLNFGDLESFNKALIAKQVWRFLPNPNLLASRVLPAKYFSNPSILEAIDIPKSSYLWKSLLWGRDLLTHGLRKSVGNGATIQMFTDPWHPRERSFRPISWLSTHLDPLVSNFIYPQGFGTLNFFLLFSILKMLSWFKKIHLRSSNIMRTAGFGMMTKGVFLESRVLTKFLWIYIYHLSLAVLQWREIYGRLFDN